MLHFELLEPKKKTSNSGLIILAHGYGSDEKDLFSFAPYLNNEDYIISVRAPYSLPFGGYAWYDIQFYANGDKHSDVAQAKESLLVLEQFIEQKVREFKIEPEQVLYIGFSQGAILGLGLYLQNKIRFNCAALSGYWLPELVDLPESSSRGDLFLSHGEQDQVIPIELARKTKELLVERQIPHEYHIYPNLGHGVDQDCFKDLLSWISDKKRRA